MQTSKLLTLAAVSAGAALLIVGCAALVPAPDYDALTAQMMKTSFRDQGIAKVERLQQDLSNEECSKAEGKPLPESVAKAIEAANLASIKPPVDGNYLGDWKEGEMLAQNGRGMTWTDKSAEPAANGGNCYNCHQLSKQEISYGTLGPSLHNYGKLRGVADPTSPAAKAIVEYTWGKLYNAKAYNACSGMPRFGHAGLLNETQLKNLMALLLDPKSPVNQ
ncbi:MAG TPA: sulfur oxidation c-type cytochrome SoxX [Burkholderiaceae bacterium]|nr:sulfur oxidation c-type cytochrome SoxX [Burkholderiaceae bacterium]